LRNGHWVTRANGAECGTYSDICGEYCCMEFTFLCLDYCDKLCEHDNTCTYYVEDRKHVKCTIPKTCDVPNDCECRAVDCSEISKDPVVQIDFDDIGDNSDNTHNPQLLGGAKILKRCEDTFQSLRIDSDEAYALIPGFNIGTSAMPHCTLMIGIHLVSIANRYGWVLGHEMLGGYDRTILMHDERFGGGIASAAGKIWQPWNKPQPPPLGKWIHVTAVFRQGKTSSVFLNGIESDKSVIATNNEGSNDIMIGHPKDYSDHWTDCWIKEVMVFDEALPNSQVVKYAKRFLEGIKV